MKVHLLLGIFAAAVLCGCAANTPNSETMIDTGTQNRQTVYGDAPAHVPLSVPTGESTFPLEHHF